MIIERHLLYGQFIAGRIKVHVFPVYAPAVTTKFPGSSTDGYNFYSYSCMVTYTKQNGW